MLHCAEPFYRPYLYRGDVENQNYMCHESGIKKEVVLENVWITHRSEIRVFTFLYHARR